MISEKNTRMKWETQWRENNKTNKQINVWAEVHNDRNEKFNREHLQQTWTAKENISELEDILIKITQS